MHDVQHRVQQGHPAQRTAPLADGNDFRPRRLAVFERHCLVFADRVASGNLRLIDAADMLQSAAEISGLCEVVGDDVVQEIMATAFTSFRSEPAK